MANRFSTFDLQASNVPKEAQGNRNKQGQLIDDCTPTLSQGDAVLRRRVVQQARVKYPDKYVQLAPVPSKLFTGKYQLCVRPKETKTVRDFEWDKVLEGDLDYIAEELLK